MCVITINLSFVSTISSGQVGVLCHFSEIENREARAGAMSGESRAGLSGF